MGEGHSSRIISENDVLILGVVPADAGLGAGDSKISSVPAPLGPDIYSYSGVELSCIIASNMGGLCPINLPIHFS